MPHKEKILVVYYSLEGNTQFIAEKIAGIMNADLLRLSPFKSLKAKGAGKFFWGGKQVFMRQKPALEPFDKDPQDYNIIFIGTPVWVSSFAPALRSFFSKVKLQGKKVALFCTSAGGKSKANGNMAKFLVGNQILGEIELQEPLTHDPQQSAAEAVEWAQNLVPLIM